MGVRVVVKDGEHIREALRRLKHLLDADRPDWVKRQRDFYEKPSVVRRRWDLIRKIRLRIYDQFTPHGIRFDYSVYPCRDLPENLDWPDEYA
jgi:ribosomal protein S21